MKLILEYYNNVGRLPVVGERLTVSELELEVINISIKSEFNSARPQYIETVWGVGYRFKM